MAEFPEVATLFDQAFAQRSSAEITAIRRRLIEATGKDTSTVGRWFKGKQRPDRDHWKAIAELASIPYESVKAACEGEAGGDLPTSVAALVEAETIQLREEVGRLSGSVLRLTKRVAALEKAARPPGGSSRSRRERS